MPSNELIGSGAPGSPISSGPNLNELPQTPGVGQPQVGDVVPKAMYDELFARFGQQGNEVGEYRKFVEDITPLLEKLEKDPSLARAVLDDKFNPEIANAILENKITIAEAAAVQQANQDVKNELGQKGYDSASVQEIAKLIDEKTRALREELEGKDELRSFEARVNEFIANTADFPNYADQISVWLDEHPDITDVETAYYAVKGKMSESEAKNAVETAQAAAGKEFALNAGGGGGSATFIRRDVPLVDQLIAPRSDPNNFG